MLFSKYVILFQITKKWESALQKEIPQDLHEVSIISEVGMHMLKNNYGHFIYHRQILEFLLWKQQKSWITNQIEKQNSHFTGKI